MANEKQFTVADGINVQRDYMLQWKSILKISKFNKLCKWIIECNNKPMESGYDVVRGTDIDNWIANNLMDRN